MKPNWSKLPLILIYKEIEYDNPHSKLAAEMGMLSMRIRSKLTQGDSLTNWIQTLVPQVFKVKIQSFSILLNDEEIEWESIEEEGDKYISGLSSVEDTDDLYYISSQVLEVAFQATSAIFTQMHEEEEKRESAQNLIDLVETDSIDYKTYKLILKTLPGNESEKKLVSKFIDFSHLIEIALFASFIILEEGLNISDETRKELIDFLRELGKKYCAYGHVLNYWHIPHDHANPIAQQALVLASILEHQYDLGEKHLLDPFPNSFEDFSQWIEGQTN